MRVGVEEMWGLVLDLRKVGGVGCKHGIKSHMTVSEYSLKNG